MANDSKHESFHVAGPQSCRIMLSAMHNAVRTNDVSQMRSVLPQWRSNALAAGFEPSYIHDELQSLLFDAARWNRVKIVSYLICCSGGAASIKSHITNIAVEMASIETLEVFLDNGWSIDSDSRCDPTPLYSAIAKDNLSLVRWILDHGADPNIPSFKPYMHILISKSTIGRSISMWPLDVAARCCSSSEFFDLLLSCGANFNICNALHAVSAKVQRDNHNKQLATIDFLLSKGLDVNKIEFEGNEAFLEQYDGVSMRRGTPLHYAAWVGNVPVARHLIRNGAKRDATDSKGDGTPLRWAKSCAQDTEYPIDEELRALLTGAIDA